MHRTTAAVERDIDDWQAIRRLLGGDAPSYVVEFIDRELGRLRYQLALQEGPTPLGPPGV